MPSYQSCSLAVDRLAYLAGGSNNESKKSKTQSLIDKMKHESEIKRGQNPFEAEEMVNNEQVCCSIKVLLTEREHLIKTIEK